MQYVLELEVRDYECDYQGIVNNAVYQNYLEHARHAIFRQYFSVPQLSQHGIHLVIAEIQLRYLQALKPQQRFAIHSSFALQGQYRLIFSQEIRRTDALILEAKVCVAALENNRPCPFCRVSEICGYSFT